VTPGTLTSAQLRSSYHHNSDGPDTTVYSADVRYRYSVGGRDYVGARYELGNWSSSSMGGELAKVNAVQQRQAQRGSIDVHYDPRNPGSSALDVRVSPLGFTWLNGGLFVLLFGLASAFPGPGAATYERLGSGSLLAVICLGAPYSVFGWSPNWFLFLAWIICLVVPFVDLGGRNTRRSGRGLR
jgi:hypothetical protein